MKRTIRISKSGPSRSSTHINGPLTDMMIRYQMNQQYLAADNAFPNLPVMKQSDLYYKMDPDDWFSIQAQPRPPATESAGGGWSVDNTSTYFCTKVAVHKDIDDDMRDNADDIIGQNLDKDATTFVTQQLLLKRELQFVNTFFKAGVWTTDLDGVSGSPSTGEVKQLNDANTDPVKTIKGVIMAMVKLTGYKPNVIIAGPETDIELQNHSKILDRIRYVGGGGFTTNDIMAKMFGVDKYVVPYIAYNTAAKNKTKSMSLMYGKDMMLVYANPTPSIEQPSAGYLFGWRGMKGASAQGMRIKRFRMEEIESDRVEGEMACDMRITAADLGGFIDDAVA